MEYIGRRVYYELATGNVIVDTGEKAGNVVATTQEQDIALFTALQGLDMAAVGVVEFAYGEYRVEFDTCTTFSIDTVTETPVFGYDAITEEIHADDAEMEQRIIDLELVVAGLLDRIATLEGGAI